MRAGLSFLFCYMMQPSGSWLTASDRCLDFLALADTRTFYGDVEFLKSSCLSQGRADRHKHGGNNMFSRKDFLSKISDLLIKTFYLASAKAKANNSLSAALFHPKVLQSVKNKTNHWSIGCLSSDSSQDVVSSEQIPACSLFSQLQWNETSQVISHEGGREEWNLFQPLIFKWTCFQTVQSELLRINS